MMTLRELRISNFVGIEKAEVTFDTPVTLFAGPNSQGKSSIRDALRFALLGKARGIQLFKDVGRLVYTGTDHDRMMVHLTYDERGQPVVVSRGVRNASAGTDAASWLIQYCLDPEAFLALSAKLRGAVLSEALGGGRNELVERAIADHVGRIADELAGELRAGGTDPHDVDALRNAVVQCRRRYKREAAEQVPEPRAADYGLDAGFDPGRADKELPRLRKDLAKLRDKRDAAMFSFRRKARLQDVRKEIKQFEARRKPLTDAERKQLHQAQLTEHLIGLVIEAGDTGSCPVCLREVDPDAMRDHQQRIIAGWNEQDQRKNELLDRMKDNESIEAAVRAKKDVLAGLEAEDKQAKGGRVSKDVDKQISDKEAKVRDLQDKLRSYERFTVACKEAVRQQQQKGRCRDLVAECDRIDAALTDGGPVKAAVAAGGSELPINAELLRAWDMPGLRWRDTGEISLDGRAIELCSRSEQYRAAAVMGLALAEVGDVGFCALDGYETLVGDTANALLNHARSSGVNNVLVFASTKQDYGKVDLPDWLQVYQVKNGSVKKIN